MSRRDEIRDKAVKNLQEFRVLMLDGHFDFGNGYHGRLYLNPHQLFRFPSTIWRVAQDLIDLLPEGVAEQVSVVAGPVTGGALPTMPLRDEFSIACPDVAPLTLEIRSSPAITIGIPPARA